MPAFSRFYGKREKGQGIQAKNFQEEKTKVAFCLAMNFLNLKPIYALA